MERVREGEDGVEGGRDARSMLGCEGDRFIDGLSGDVV